ncbi:MAG: glycosyltransferase [Armatimonadetes bacterium]|nr:glycosyltransferase [Armatimonadota bacterium]
MRGPLRIAMISDSSLPILNGVSVSVDALVSELRAAGHSVHLFTARYPGFSDPDPNCHRFRALEFPWAKGYPVAYPPYYRMLGVFREEEYDLIHTHTPWVLGFVGLRWAESHDLPIVSTYHTLYDRYAHHIPLLPRRYLRFRIAKHTNFYYNRVNEVITPSEAAARWLRRHSVDTPINVIPTGVPGGGRYTRAEARQAVGLRPETRVMLYVGRLAAEKNLQTLFKMAARVFAEMPNAELWLVGDGAFRAEATRQVRALGIGDRVKFVGFVERAEVDQYYAASDLFVFSSVTETQGLVVTEAMTYGLPAVVVSGGGASQTVVEGLNGVIVPDDDAVFAGQVLQVLRDEELYQQLSLGAAESSRQYTTSAMADRVLEVYERVLGNKRSVASLV